MRKICNMTIKEAKNIMDIHNFLTENVQIDYNYDILNKTKLKSITWWKDFNKEKIAEYDNENSILYIMNAN